MKRFEFKKIDAFATSASDGNPAGYIRLDAWADISEAEMLRIARELKGFVSEVGFLVREAADEFALKYYSAEREVDFCGHATVAVMYDGSSPPPLVTWRTRPPARATPPSVITYCKTVCGGEIRWPSSRTAAGRGSI